MSCCGIYNPILLVDHFSTIVVPANMSAKNDVELLRWLVRVARVKDALKDLLKKELFSRNGHISGIQSSLLDALISVARSSFDLGSRNAFFLPCL